MRRIALLDEPTPDQADYLETLTALMENYENRCYPIRPLSGLSALRALLAQHHMTASDLGRLLGNRSLGAKILSGTRELSKSHILVLSDHFKVNPGLFLAPEPSGGAGRRARRGRRPPSLT